MKDINNKYKDLIKNLNIILSIFCLNLFLNFYIYIFFKNYNFHMFYYTL